MLELCPRSLKVYPVKKEKWFFSKIFLFLTDTNEEEIVLINNVYGVYIPNYEASLHH